MFIELLSLQPPLDGQRETTSIYEQEFINIKLTTRFKWDEDDKETYVFFSGGDFICVKETPEEIIQKIKEAQCSPIS